MIAIARADDTVEITVGEDTIVVPDLKIPQSVEWSASKIPGQAAFFVTFETATKQATTLWHGPYTIGAGTYYIIDAPKRVLVALRNQLGAANVAPLIKALRASAALRTWAKAQGFTLVRNSLDEPVSVLPPLVICGHAPIDLDGDDLDEATPLPDLEQ